MKNTKPNFQQNALSAFSFRLCCCIKVFTLINKIRTSPEDENIKIKQCTTNRKKPVDTINIWYYDPTQWWNLIKRYGDMARWWNVSNLWQICCFQTNINILCSISYTTLFVSIIKITFIIDVYFNFMGEPRGEICVEIVIRWILNISIKLKFVMKLFRKT